MTDLLSYDNKSVIHYKCQKIRLRKRRSILYKSFFNLPSAYFITYVIPQHILFPKSMCWGILADMKEPRRLSYGTAFMIAIIIAGSAFVYKNFMNLPVLLPREVPVLDAPGSTHAHASLLIMIGNRAVSFCDPKFMLKNPLMHFENDNCTVIHKHAKGVTLPTFLKTLGVELSSRCIVLPEEGKKCNDDTNTLRVLYNGAEVPIEDLSYHELENNDHILINFGLEEDAALRFKYNQVPMIPLDVNKGETRR